MHEEKIVRFEINPHNKQLLELQLESKDIYNTYWGNTTFELIIDLNHIAFSNIEHLSDRLFSWLKSFVININIVINNVPEDPASKANNNSFFNSIINKLETCKMIKTLKFTVIQPNLFHCENISIITKINHLKIIDLSSINIQQEEITNYIPVIIDLLNNIPNKSKINKLSLPANFKKQLINVENILDNEFFVAVKRALLESASLIEIGQLPIFVGLQEDIETIVNSKQGSDLEKLYYRHDKDLENLIQLKKIPFPTNDIYNLIINISNKINNTFKDLEKFIPIITSMKPKNIYWLDKILREKLNNASYIITCLTTVKLCENSQEILFKMLQSLVSDLMSCRIKEINPYNEKLTEFVFIDEIVTKDIILRTVLKIHLEFDLSKDDYLAKILANLIEEFVNYSGGIKLSNEHGRIVYPNKLEYVNLLMELANNNLCLHNNISNKDLIHQEEKTRYSIEIEQSENFKELLFAFNNQFHDFHKKFICNNQKITLANSSQSLLPF
jgi:hypothetical protein